MTSLLDTTAWLVGIPSPTGEESQLRDAIAGRLEPFPLRTIQDSLVVGDPTPEKVLLVGHIDTVPLQGETGARVDGDRLYGLGSTDMKGGVAVMIHLLEDLGTENVVGVFYAGEEGPISGNQLGPILDTVEGVAQARAGIVLEPSNREMQAGCNGVVNATVSFLGDPAHSARPWLGENAVTKAGSLLATLHDAQPELHEIDGLPFREVISVTRAHGGVANNVIPGRFDLNVNFRFAPDRTLDEAVAKLRAVCASADEIEITDLAPAAMPDVDHPLFVSLAEAAGAPTTHKQGWTDVAQLRARGIPAVNFGPGETDLAHKPGESLRISDLNWAHDALSQVLR
ncbi:MAG: succinyl-diaminopimelate desuccinylase [Actinobacteria bacterium]|nr:MAG: succinyl-diaminopimelate desuccinylase [Actinomycetota bacterium]